MGETILRPHEEIVAKNFSALVGKVLTQIEAAIGDATQRKSLKKIIEQQIYDCRNDVLCQLTELGVYTMATDKPAVKPGSEGKQG
jgi:hypothetical protein